MGHWRSVRGHAFTGHQGSSAVAAPVGLQGPGVEWLMAAIGPSKAIGVAAVVGVTIGNGVAVANLNGGTLRKHQTTAVAHALHHWPW
jgi:chorismate synthase